MTCGLFEYVDSLNVPRRARNEVIDDGLYFAFGLDAGRIVGVDEFEVVEENKYGSLEGLDCAVRERASNLASWGAMAGSTTG